jgi:uncharacterized membrane protein (DUF106 family)
MGEVLSALTAVLTRVFDVLVLPFGSHRTAGLIALSMLTGAGLTLLYRALADEAAIRRTRERFQARVIEMRLYPDDLVLILRALGGAIAAQGSYLRVAAKPILVVALIAIPFFLQIESRYSRAPLSPSGTTVVTARLKAGLDVLTVPNELVWASNGNPVDLRPVRAPGPREIAWRVNVVPGRAPLLMKVYGQDYRFDMCAQRDGRAIGHERRARSIAGSFTQIGLPRIGNDSPIEMVTVAYSHASYDVFGKRMSWLVVFLLGTMVGAAIPAMLLRVAL